MTKGKRLGCGLLGLAAAVLLAVGPAAASLAKNATAAEQKKMIESPTLVDIRSVLGTPADDSSGVSDFTVGPGGEIVIGYQYYDVDEDNYETDFASEIAPRLQHLYKKFKNLDRVRFEIIANNPDAQPFWKPFSQFSMDRKTIEKLRWTWFITRDILDQVLKNKK